MSELKTILVGIIGLVVFFSPMWITAVVSLGLGDNFNHSMDNGGFAFIMTCVAFLGLLMAWTVGNLILSMKRGSY